MKINQDTWDSWSTEYFQQYFGEKVRERRILMGLTQQQLGEAVGLSKQAINDIEKGRRSTLITKGLKIAECLNTSFMYLAGRNDDPDPNNDEF